MNRVLVVVAHADDEVLGVGGTLAKWVAAGASVSVLFMSDGEISREGGDSRIKQRREATDRAAAVLGFSVLNYGSFPDNQLDTVPMLELAKYVEREVELLMPDTVLTHSSADLNIDHRRTLEAVLVACRPVPQSPVKRLGCFEVPSATGWGSDVSFEPNYWVALPDSCRAKKMEALSCYGAEMREYPHARSYRAVESLAEVRGSTVGVDRAEALQWLRWLED